MEAVLVYINDWLSSKSIAQMDGDEERGFFRLLLHCASQPDCGIEKDEKKLAIHSLLDEQWVKESPRWKYQFGLTSGQKLLSCFFEVVNSKPVSALTGEPVDLNPKCEIKIEELKPGRIYNQILLKRFAEFKRRQKKAEGAAAKRWSSKDAQAQELHAPSIAPACSSNATRVESESKSENKNLSPEKTEDSKTVELPKSTGIIVAGTDGWEELIELAVQAGMVHDPSPTSDLCVKWWARANMQLKQEIRDSIKKRIACGEFNPENPQYTPSLENYILKGKWRQTLRVMNAQVLPINGRAQQQPNTPPAINYPKNRPTPEQLERMENAMKKQPPPRMREAS